MIATILSIVAVLVVLLVVSLFGVAVWARRGERKPDVGGVRTLAAFKGGDQFISVEERQDEQTEGSAALGGGLLAALVREIEKQGLEVEAPDRQGIGEGCRPEIQIPAPFQHEQGLAMHAVPGARRVRIELQR